MGAVTLWGREHVAYGDIVVRDAGPGSAVALTRGLHPKPYRYTDPNEDVVAAVTGPRAALLVVADGHNGAASSEVAVATVLERLGDDPPPADLDDEEMVRLFHDVGWAVLHATTALDRARRESRTTLSVALVAGGVLQWAAMGDSPVVVADLESAHELTVPTHHFVGWPLPAGQVDRLLQRGRTPVSDEAWVAVLSDGFSNFTGGRTTADAVHRVLATAGTAEAGAAELVQAAFAGGAGDNVAAAVLAPRGADHPRAGPSAG